MKITHKKFRALTALTIGMDPAYRQTSVNARELQEQTDTFKARKAEEEKEKNREEREKQERIKREQYEHITHLQSLSKYLESI